MKLMYLDDRHRARIIKNVGMMEGYEDDALSFKIYKTKIELHGVIHTLFKTIPKHRVILIGDGSGHDGGD